MNPSSTPIMAVRRSSSRSSTWRSQSELAERALCLGALPAGDRAMTCTQGRDCVASKLPIGKSDLKSQISHFRLDGAGSGQANR
ncbi:MAG: hypothetical protein GX616_17830 [Planctomycetes bacterium]|nr:hypothetical protein [Planctomycetota bacterium]